MNKVSAVLEITCLPEPESNIKIKLIETGKSQSSCCSPFDDVRSAYSAKYYQNVASEAGLQQMAFHSLAKFNFASKFFHL